MKTKVVRYMIDEAYAYNNGKRITIWFENGEKPLLENANYRWFSNVSKRFKTKKRLLRAIRSIYEMLGHDTHVFCSVVKIIKIDNKKYERFYVWEWGEKDVADNVLG